MHGPIEILAAVEGPVDEAVLRRLAEEVGVAAPVVYGKRGKDALRQRLSGYNNAARFGPWAVLVDLNHDADCAPRLVSDWLPAPSARMCFRVVVRKIEAWLLADRERLAAFLGVAPARIPANPELEPDPKRTLIELSRQSRRREIREDMVARPESGREVGPAYTSRLIEFIQCSWRPAEAAARSDSLRRCLRRLRELVQDAQT
jgi:hypothetical protein